MKSILLTLISLCLLLIPCVFYAQPSPDTVASHIENAMALRYGNCRHIVRTVNGDILVAWIAGPSLGRQVVFSYYDPILLDWSSPSVVSNALDSASTIGLAADNSGYVHASWIEYNGTKYRVCYQRYNLSTGLWDRWARVDTGGTYNSNLALTASTIEIDTYGNPFVAWSTSWQNDGVNERIYVNWSSNGGISWGTPVDLSKQGNLPSQQFSEPALSSGPNGMMVCTWRDSLYTDTLGLFTNDDVALVRYTPGSGWSLPESVTVDQLNEENGDKCAPNVVVDSQGRIHLVYYWSEANYRNTYYTWSDSGLNNRGIWSKEANISGFLNATQPQWPSIGIDPNGNLYVALAENDQNGRRKIYYVCSKDRGTSWSAPVLADTIVLGTRRYPSIVQHIPSAVGPFNGKAELIYSFERYDAPFKDTLLYYLQLPTPTVNPPIITSTFPSDGDTNISVDSKLWATFSEPMNPATVTIVITSDPGGWVPVWSSGNTKVTYTHNSFFGSFQYACKVTGANNSGTLLGSGATPNPWRFITAPDSAPTLVSTSPANQDTGVASNANIVVTFSRAMDTTTVTFNCFPNPGGWTKTWTPDSTVLTLTHTAFASGTNYIFTISGNSAGGISLARNEVPNPWSFKTGEVGVEEKISHQSSVISHQLMQNQPNPFSSATEIAYQVAEGEKRGKWETEKGKKAELQVSLKIYNIAGQLVKILVDERCSGGFYTRRWDSRDESGKKVASGVYFYRLTAGDFIDTKKMILVR